MTSSGGADSQAGPATEPLKAAPTDTDWLEAMESIRGSGRPDPDHVILGMHTEEG
jgi:hypothetical protein